MADEEEPDIPRLERRPRWRAYRPLLWWGIIVGLVVVWQAHRTQIAQTTLLYEVSVEGTDYPGQIESRLDGEAHRSGFLCGLGRKTLAIEVPEAEPFETNVFVWYGANDLGRIDLRWKSGQFSLVAEPSPRSVQLQSTRRSLTLDYVGPTNLTLPVGQYRVTATYEHFQYRSSFEIEAGTTTRSTLNPEVGSLILTADPDGEFELEAKAARNFRLRGQLPQSYTNLPAGDYTLRVWRGDYAQSRPITLTAGGTENVRVRFAYGGVRFASTPELATVLDAQGTKLGLTPLTVTNLIPGAHRFRIEYPEHDQEEITVTVLDDDISEARVELRDRIYDQAMERAKALGNQGRYPSALGELQTALGRKPHDAAAKNLKTDLQVAEALDAARDHHRRNEPAEAMQAVKRALGFRPGYTDAVRLREDLEREALARKERRLADLVRQADTARKNNDLPKAHDLFIQALEVAPTNVELQKQKEAVAQELTRRAEEARLKAVQTALRTVTASEPNTQWFDQHEWDLAGEPAVVKAALERLFTKQTTQWRLKTNQALAGGMTLYRGVQGGFIKGPFNRCVVVVGQTEAGRTRVAAKFWEYALPEIQDVANGRDENRLTPIHPERYKPEDPSRARTWLQGTYYEFERALKKELP